MVSTTTAASVIVIMMMSVVFAHDAVAIKATSKNNRKAHDDGVAFRDTKFLRNSKHLAAVPGHLTGFAQSGPRPANLANLAQKQQHAKHVLDEKEDDHAGDDNCSDGDQFSIKAPSAPKIEGCFRDTGVDLYGESAYSQTGINAVQQAVVHAYKYYDPSESMGEPLDLWVVSYLISEVQVYAYCVSLDSASGTHPVDVKTWYCDLEQTGKVEEVDDDEFGVECGCYRD